MLLRSRPSIRRTLTTATALTLLLTAQRLVAQPAPTAKAPATTEAPQPTPLPGAGTAAPPSLPPPSLPPNATSPAAASAAPSAGAPLPNGTNSAAPQAPQMPPQQPAAIPAPPTPPNPGAGPAPLAVASSPAGISLPSALSPVRIETDNSRFPTEVWGDDDVNVRRRIAFGDFGVSANIEYRANLLYVNPISLATTTFRSASWIEHRLRLDFSADYLDKVRIYFSADVLDGVLWGDNGDFGGTPSSNIGLSASAKNPNVTRPCVALASDGDPLDKTSYGYTLCEQDTIRVRKLYTQISTPIGALRIGRQSVIQGSGVQASDGEGRTNRFGFARTGNVVDRILFATKPLEALKPKDKRNVSETEGLIFATGYDRPVTDSPQLFKDDVHQWFTALLFSAPEHPLGKNLFSTVYFVHRWNPINATGINVFGVRANTTLKAGFSAGFDIAYNFGSTREVAEAYKFITNDPVVDQEVSQFGARAVVRWDHPKISAYLEFDYASGDADPNVRTPLSQFVFAEDTNVGLLMFEHVLAFQTARAAAAGVETLRRLGAKSFPAEVINTRGSFTNAVALFPQVDVRPLPDLLLRAGVLFAWTDSPVIDQVASLQVRDGESVDDDVINYVGAPSLGRTYYGTELDARIRYQLLQHVNFDLEGAVLFPGDALQNKHNEAINSFLLQGRTTVFF